MEETFGFEREILVVYSSYNTLEPRSMQAIEHFLSDDPAKGRVDTMVVFLISEALDPASWAREYMTSNPESRLVCGFHASNLRAAVADAWYVRGVLASQLYQRDLFDFRLPIRNDSYFFGREDLVFDFYNAFKRSENRGLFGLRKTGKTSLLFKLERRIVTANDGYIFYFDCKNPSLRVLTWDQLLYRISNEIARKFQKNIPSNITNPSDVFIWSISCCPTERQIGLIFDEIEYISPYSLLDKHWRDDFIPFWQTIWAAQSQKRNLSVFLAGVNPTVVEQDLIGGIQNPLFGIVPHQYLQGLRLDELRRLVRTLGRRMGLIFSTEAIEYLFGRYGGHPLLSRIACSLTHRYLKDAKEPLPFNVNEDHLRRLEDQRDAEISFYCRHVVSELKLFYPDEYELLERIAIGQLADYMEFTTIPEYTAHLSNYGLLDRDETGRTRISIPVVSKFLGLEVARKEGRKTILKVIEPSRRTDWVKHRIISINSNLDALQSAIERYSLPPLFGALSYPESHKFFSASPCTNENEFANFMNICNRCFVESMETYGKSIGKDKYFWSNIVTEYKSLGDALKRIKLYRHHRVHIRLNPRVDAELNNYLNIDLEGRNPSQVADLWFVLQQCVLDGLLVGILTELDRISS